MKHEHIVYVMYYYYISIVTLYEVAYKMPTLTTHKQKYALASIIVVT